MSSTQPSLQKDELQDSWVDVHYNGQNSPRKDGAPETSGIYTALNIEKLLTDAQRESVNNSREASARGSPKSLHSPVNELSSHGSGTQLSQDERVDPGTDWIWDWSSGPERNPTDLGAKFRRPVQRPRHSLRHVEKTSIFNLENLQKLLFTHACTFVLGATVMFFCLKKYCHWARIPASE